MYTYTPNFRSIFIRINSNIRKYLAGSIVELSDFDSSVRVILIELID